MAISCYNEVTIYFSHCALLFLFLCIELKPILKPLTKVRYWKKLLNFSIHVTNVTLLYMYVFECRLQSSHHMKVSYSGSIRLIFLIEFKKDNYSNYKYYP